VFETSNKLNKIWLKILNSHIFKVGLLYWTKVKKNNNFNFYLKDKKYI